MLKTTRRVLAALATTMIATAGTLALGVAPAHAAATGLLQSKVSGSVYSWDEIVYLGMIPGGTAKTFFYKIVNTSSTAEQFEVVVTSQHPALTSRLYQGSTALPKNSYFTPFIAAGGSLVLNVKVTLPAGTPQGAYTTQVKLLDPATHATLDTNLAIAHATYQTGTKRNDLFLKTGTQPYVGGSFGEQAESSSAIRPGSTATFSLRLQNNGGTPATMKLKGGTTPYCPSNFSITIKQGTRNVTAAVQAGVYSTGLLPPGGKKELKVQIKLLSAPACSAAYYDFTALGPDPSVVQYAQVLVGV